MARLEFFLLGPPRLQRDGVPLQFDRHKVMALAAYLAMAGLEAEGRHLSRDRLVTLFSPDLEPRGPLGACVATCHNVGAGEGPL